MTNNSKSSSSPSPARYTDRGIPNDSKNKRFAGQSRSNSRGASNHRPQTSTPPVGSDVQENQKNRRISVINNTNHNNNSLRTKTSEVHVSHKIGRELNRNFHRKQKRGSVVNGVYQQHAKHRYSITAPLPSVDHISTQHKAKSYSAQSPNLYRKGNRNVKSLPNPQNRGNKMQHRGRTMERNKQTKKLSISMERTNAKFLEMKNQEMNKDVEWNRQFLPDHHYVYTDGSWKAPNLGGVGIYHGPDHILNRSFKVYKPNVYLCEVEAIKTALQDLLKDGSYKSKTIVIRTDCLETITAFPKGVYIEHVYAHDTDTDYGNLAADMLARVALSESNNGKSRVRDRSLDRNRLLSKNNNVDLIDTHRVFVGGKLTRSDSESSRSRKNSSNREASITDVPPSYTGSFNIPAMTEPSYCMTIGTDVPELLTHFIPACAEMPEDSLGDSCAMVVPKNFTVVKEPKDYHQSNNEARAPDTGLSSVIREVTDTDNSGEWNDQAEAPEDCLTKCLMFFKNAITFCCKSKQ